VPTGAAGGRWAATPFDLKGRVEEAAGDLAGGKRIKDEGKTDRRRGQCEGRR
jgi:uncharacterized protein YjbJ (UPF0337 family)